MTKANQEEIEKYISNNPNSDRNIVTEAVNR
jgi:hypothetical protein